MIKEIDVPLPRTPYTNIPSNGEDTNKLFGLIKTITYCINSILKD